MKACCAGHALSFPIIVLTAILATGCVGSRAEAELAVVGLKCEHLVNPLGIATQKPRLSWRSESQDRGQLQAAYRILVASSPEKLAQDEGDLWDSGQVASDQSLLVEYQGQPLASHEQCFWKVQVWDQDGQASTWSEPALWTMGILDPDQWHAQWIGLDDQRQDEVLQDTNWIWYPEGNPAESAPVAERFFRRKFTLPAGRTVKKATLRFAADNWCQVSFNGQNLGTQDKYQTVKERDLTHRLQTGENVLAVSAKNTGAAPNPAALVMWLRIDFTEGEPLVLTTDAAWRTAQASASGWQSLRFDDASWVAAKDLGPVGSQPWGEVRTVEERRLSARYFRKEFAVEKDIRRATVYLSGLGLSELYVNGQRIGNAVLSPGLTEYPKRVFYVTHDVTDSLQKGSNALGVILGNGRYYAPRSRAQGTQTYGYPKLLLHLRIEHQDGTISEVVSDESWRMTAKGPIQANNEYDGEEYDARLEMAGWDQPGFDESQFTPATLCEVPSGEVVPEPINPIRVTETLRPKSITEPEPGVFIFDMGQNMVGWCRLQVSGPAGTVVRLRHAETLTPEGTLYLANIRSAQVTDTYTLKGSGAEVWEPRFTYHGFRYVEVTGFPGKPTLDSISGQVVHDAIERTGQFECSNPLLNQIFNNVVWGVRGNYRSVPTDCPQRDERQGWLGDRSEESRGEAYLHDTSALYSKWLQDMADAQKPSGSVSDVCPTYWSVYSDNVTWPSSTVLIPLTLYRQFGDRAIVERHYDSARRWVEYMLTFVKDGITERDTYGDWCVPPEDPKLIHSQDPARKTSKGVLATSYLFHDLQVMQQYARLLGKLDDAEQFGQEAEKMKSAFNARFLNRDQGYYDNGTQTSCVLPLYFGLVPEDMRQRVFGHLVNKITVESKGHIGTGLIGGQYLNRVLTAGGRADLAYTMATQKDYPSWGYMVAQGATTIWELWNGNTADPSMNSGNHVMLVGDLVIWLFEDLAGICPDIQQPGFKRVVMRPQVIGGLDFVKASYLSSHGPICSEWHQQHGGFDWQITLPANTQAEVYLPAADAASVTEGEQPATSAPCVKFLRQEGDRAVFEIGSGSYHFQVHP